LARLSAASSCASQTFQRQIVVNDVHDSCERDSKLAENLPKLDASEIYCSGSKQAPGRWIHFTQCGSCNGAFCRIWVQLGQSVWV